MIHKCFHVICEGQTDYEIFKAIISSVGNMAGKSFKSMPLFPPVKRNNGGWGNLKNWCLNQAAALTGQNNRQAAILLGAKPNHGIQNRPSDKISAALSLTGGCANNFILIQLDTDIAEHLVVEMGIVDIDFPLSPLVRQDVCENALDKWLGGHVAHKNSKLFYCLSSIAIENWILSMHSPADLLSTCSIKVAGIPYDHIHEPGKKLVALGYPSDSDGKIKKKVGAYKDYGRRLANVLTPCRSRSYLLDNFCNTLLTA